MSVDSGDEEESVAKRRRPPDEEYYVDYQTEHVRQGDIFANVPNLMALPEPPPEDQPIGTGARRVLETPFFFEGLGMLVSHSSSLMNQPPLTRGYSHVARLLAPVVPIAMLDEAGLTNEDFYRLLRKEDKIGSYMYLPPCPGVFAEERVVVLYRPSLVHHDVLEGQRRCQLQEPALKQLQVKLVFAFTGEWTNPESFSPSMRDHWNEG